MSSKPKNAILLASISKTRANGALLLGDAKLLRDFERFSTATSLAVLAQEEFAKAFLLQLVVDDALPWIPEVRRTLTKHQCKHLAAIIMEWFTDWEELMKRSATRLDALQHRIDWLRRSAERKKVGIADPDDDPEPPQPEVELPADVADAINIFRHEEVERFRVFGNPLRDSDWSIGRSRKIADGFLEKKKQRALYVDITKTGAVGMHPGLVSKEEAAKEIEAAEKMTHGPYFASEEYEYLLEVTKLVFANLRNESTQRSASDERRS